MNGTSAEILLVKGDKVYFATFVHADILSCD